MDEKDLKKEKIVSWERVYKTEGNAVYFGLKRVEKFPPAQPSQDDLKRLLSSKPSAEDLDKIWTNLLGETEG